MRFSKFTKHFKWLDFINRNSLHWAVFLVIPVILLTIHIYFMNTVDNNRWEICTDPDYAYLISSIDISQLRHSRLVIHPGTTLQIFNHLIMKCTYWLSASQRTDSFKNSVLSEPILYLNVMNRTYAFLNIALVFLLGYITFRITHNAAASMLLQCTPFLSGHIFIFGFRKITADVLLTSISLVLVLILIKMVKTSEPESMLKRHTKYAILLGLVFGFGIATRVHFALMLPIPLIIIPAVLPKITFVLVMFASSFLFTLPIMAKYGRILSFLNDIITHSGLYGRGSDQMIEWKQYTANFLHLARENIPFIILFFLSTLCIIILATSRTEKCLKARLDSKLFIALITTQAVAFIVVNKHFKSKYLLPVLCMSALIVYLIYIHLSRSLAGGKTQSFMPVALKGIQYVTLVFLILTFFFSAAEIFTYHRDRIHKRNETIAIKEKIKNEFSDYGIIYYYNAPTVIFGLEFGNRWTPKYADDLRRIHGDHFFYDVTGNWFYIWDRKHNKISLSELRKKFANKLIFLGDPIHRIRKSTKIRNLPLEDIFGGEFITLYRLQDDHKTEKHTSPHPVETPPAVPAQDARKTANR